MKIIEAKITNFRALESVCVQLNQFSVIIGENDVGKTSLLFALEKFFTQKKLSDPKDWYKRQIENPIRMVLIFTELPVDVDLQPFIRADGSMVISGVFAIESPPEYNVILADQAPARISKVLLKKWFSLDSFHFIPVRRDLLVQFSMNKTALLGKLLRAKMNQALKDASASTSIGEIKEILTNAISEPREKMERFLREQLNNNSIELGFDDLEIDPTEGVSFSVRLSDDRVRGIEISNRGAGTQNNLIIALFRLIAESNLDGSFIFAMEEPENSLHPKAQRQLLSIIQEISESTQVLVTTHSPVFIDRSKFENNILLTRTLNGNTVAKIFDQSTLSTIRADLGIKASDALLKGGGNCAILVEGKTEEDGFPVFMEMLGLSEFELGTAIINMGGSDFVRARNIVQLLKGYEIPCVMVLDRDAEKTEDDLMRMMDTTLNNLKHVFRLQEGTIEDYYPTEIIIEVINEDFSPSSPITISEIDESLSGKQNLDQYQKLMHKHDAGSSIEYLKRALGGKGTRLLKEKGLPVHDEIKAILEAVRQVASES
ncbi:MAG: AAA family ATPase [Bdellovibrionales bacterium]|jgi:putative ATP-dependent endonuclease of the OLD family|nr:AAA family ATPase [Bdellovibrionales bacterium]